MLPPPVAAASSSASADLPLAVGPAISTALLFSGCELTWMSLVATLICNPVDPALDSTVVDGARAILPSPGPARWLFDEVAVDIPFTGSEDITGIAARLRRARGDLPIDIVGQPQAARPPPPASGAGGLADRYRGAPASRAAQEAVSRRHGFHRDRPGMRRRAG